MTARRAWRLLFDQQVDDTASMLLASVEMRATRGGANLCSGGRALGSLDTVAGPLTGAFDGNAATYWTTSYSHGGWIGYDFGAGVTYDVVEVALTSSTQPSGDKAVPVRFRVQSCADPFIGDWVTEWCGVYFPTSLTSWGLGVTRVFSKPTSTEISAAYRYWRLAVSRIQYSGFSYAYAAIIGEVELRATEGGVDLTTPGGAITSIADVAGHAAASAFDNDTATYWSAPANTVNPRWLQYDLGASPSVVQEVALTVPNDVALLDQAPVQVDLLGSDDGSTWIVVGSWDSLLWWSVGETKLLKLTPPVPPSPLSLAVTFGGVPATGVTEVDATHIDVIAPAHTAGVVDVTASRPESAAPATLVGSYSYLNLPQTQQPILDWINSPTEDDPIIISGYVPSYLEGSLSMSVSASADLVKYSVQPVVDDIVSPTNADPIYITGFVPGLTVEMPTDGATIPFPYPAYGKTYPGSTVEVYDGSGNLIGTDVPEDENWQSIIDEPVS